VADRSIDLDRIFCCWLLIQNSLLLAGVQSFLGSKLHVGTPLSYVLPAAQVGGGPLPAPTQLPPSSWSTLTYWVLQAFSQLVVGPREGRIGGGGRRCACAAASPPLSAGDVST
jgi:hypothetical protein